MSVLRVRLPWLAEAFVCYRLGVTGSGAGGQFLRLTGAWHPATAQNAIMS